VTLNGIKKLDNNRCAVEFILSNKLKITKATMDAKRLRALCLIHKIEQDLLESLEDRYKHIHEKAMLYLTGYYTKLRKMQEDYFYCGYAGTIESYSPFF
jgi:hypothetical protein